MASDRNEHEPDEYDPEAEFRDPESDSITIPEVSTENAGSDLRSDLKAEFEEDKVSTPELSTAETDVDGDLLKTFWALVIVVNAAVFAIALGAMFLLFEGATYGAYLLAGGLALTGFSIHRYRRFQRTNGDDTLADEADAESTDDSLEAADSEETED